ncbi:MAG: T9SS type A sorting domain-containing protein [Spirochaetes bacterium]|nr:T9SS type A sorting domain-containing protein [Spirochaetota bacterium]
MRVVSMLLLSFLTAGAAFAEFGTQGKITYITNGTFSASSVPYAYIEYLPTNYNDMPTARFRLLIFLHGLGERGNGSSNELSRVLREGLPPLITNGMHLPAIVLMLQSPTNYDRWLSGRIYTMIKHATNFYRVDPDRIVLTGLSLGGMGCWDFMQNYPGILAACVPVCGPAASWVLNTNITENLASTPIWVHHSTDDDVVSVNDSTKWINETRNALYEPDPPSCDIGYTAGTYATGHDDAGTWTWQPGTNYVSGTKLLYSKYPTGKHYAWRIAYSNSNVYEWLFAHSNPARIILTNAVMTPGIGTNGCSVSFNANALGFGTMVTGMTLDLAAVSGGTCAMTNAGGNLYGYTYSLPSSLAGGTYKILVIATESSGNSRTNVLWITVTNIGFTPPPPAAPSGLSLTDLGAMALRLSWADNSSTESAFRIYRSINGVSYAYLADVGANVTAYTDISLDANILYWYKVSATNSGGESPLCTASSKQPNVFLSLVNAAVEARNAPRSAIISYDLIKNCTNAASITLEYAVANSGAWNVMPPADIAGSLTLLTSGRFTNEWRYREMPDQSVRYDVRIIARVTTNSASVMLTNISITEPVTNLRSTIIRNNPCRTGGTVIIDTIPEATTATLYTVSGKRIAVLSAEDGRIVWALSTTNGKRVGPGVYLCHIATGSGMVVMKIMVQP